MPRSRGWLILPAIIFVLLSAIPASAIPWTAFTTDSVWNRDISASAVDPNSDAIISYIASTNTPGYVKVINTGGGTQGAGIWWVRLGDPTEAAQVHQNSCTGSFFPEYVTIPAGAQPGSGSDAHMTVINIRDVPGYNLSLWQAVHCTDGSWAASTLDIYYNPSNGLAKTATGTDCTKATYPPGGCHGHRGFPAYTYNIRSDEAEAGVVPHALKLGIHLTGGVACGLLNHYWPAAGDEGGNSACAPEGTRIRLKATADCGLATGSFGPALCQALQTFGMFVGDKTGGDAHLAVEQTGLDGGLSWSGVLSSTSLQAFPLTTDFWEVVTLGS